MDQATRVPPHRRRTTSLVFLGAVLCLLSVVATGCGRHYPPRLIPDSSVGSDFAALASSAWDRFLTVFQARSHCFGDVHLHAAYSLEGRAGYDPDTATATVLVPATPAMLESGLIHEWAHHLDYQCPALRQLRPAFLAAQGLPAETPWRMEYNPGNTPTDVWAAQPSEQFAEATIVVVMGDRPIPTAARVSPEAVRVIEQWASGAEHRP